jgi:hypothetical protein
MSMSASGASTSRAICLLQTASRFCWWANWASTRNGSWRSRSTGINCMDYGSLIPSHGISQVRSHTATSRISPFESGWIERVRAAKPDVIYALLNVHALRLIDAVLDAKLDIPIVFHFKEGPFIAHEHGTWPILVRIHARKCRSGIDHAREPRMVPTRDRRDARRIQNLYLWTGTCLSSIG